MSPRVDWARMLQMSSRADWFDVSTGDLSVLEIREANEHFSYFYDPAHRTLIKQFLLGERARVATLCEVRLVAKDGRYSPRVRLLKVETTKGSAVTLESIETTSTAVKASVDTGDVHESFAKLMGYLLSLKEVDTGAGTFQMTAASDAQILRTLNLRDRAELVPLISTLLGSSLSESEINLISGRKAQIEHFEKLLNEPEFFANEMQRLGKTSEALWQSFFEDATWIFGYGLSLIGHDAFDSGRLEQITTGANVWSGAGKRSDAVMRSRAVISTLLFCEIKRHDTPLLKNQPYRPPDVYVASDELVGGVAQLQKTVRKAYRQFIDQIERQTAADGTPTGLDFSTTRARQVLLIGHLGQLRSEHGINGEKMESFELYRKANMEVEIITFDELLARARFIVSG